jgi:hypothetical protein
MRYNYKKGVTEKDKNGHKKLWMGFFVLFFGFKATKYTTTPHRKIKNIILSIRIFLRDSTFLPIFNL